MSSLSFRNSTARGLAMTLLAGEWRIKKLIERSIVFFGDYEPEMVPLLKSVRRRFRRAPHSELESLSEFIAANEHFHRALWSRRMRRLLIDEPSMGITPWPVSQLASEQAVATLLNLPGNTLEAFADRRGYELRQTIEKLRRYRYRWVKKRRGGQRLIEEPKPLLRRAQRTVLEKVLNAIPPHEAAHGFVRGRSVRSFAAPHVGKSVVLRLDLVDFFAQVRSRAVYGIFRTAGYSEHVAHLLAAMCMNRTPRWVFEEAKPGHPTVRELNEWRAQQRRFASLHLPQGAPTSPALANLAAFRMDVRLSALAKKFGAAYTRYADDLAFSGDDHLARVHQRFLNQAAAIALSEGFEVNFRKVRVMKKSVRQRIAGVVVNAKQNVSRRDFDELKATLHNCATKGPASQNLSNVHSIKDHLRGRIAWVESLNPKRGEKLRKIFDRIQWPADGS